MDSGARTQQMLDLEQVSQRQIGTGDNSISLLLDIVGVVWSGSNLAISQTVVKRVGLRVRNLDVLQSHPVVYCKGDIILIYFG